MISLGRNSIRHFIDILAHGLSEKRTIFAVGNGGSASNASHFITDLGKGASDALENEGLGRFSAISLSDNVSWITALGNDYDYSRIFTEQLASLAQSKDILIGISVSGTSPNLVEAFKWAQAMDLATIALTGLDTSDKTDHIGKLSDLWIEVKATHYGIVEDAQMAILHAACYYFMENAKQVAQDLKGDL
jgi:D-sedoheptulose 7-phosphate isomerase